MQGNLIREESMTDLWNVWFSELHQNRVGLTIKVKRLLYSGESPFQRIDVLDTYEFGKILVLYGSIMITEKDEFVYHEMLGHVPLFTHPDPRQVLVIGGGDGGSVREAIKHPEVERVTLVEIDEMVVRKCQEYFPEVAKDLSNPRTRLVFEDGEKYLSSTNEKYDVILCDAPDPIGPGEVLFQKKFHQMAFDCLKEDGIFVTQSESPLYHQRTLKNMYDNLKGLFPIVRVYWAYIPTYPSAIWSFSLCSKKYDPLLDFDEARFKRIQPFTKYYNEGIHRACFVLPNFVKEVLGE